MTRRWAVVWQGKAATVFLDANGDWSLNASDSQVFDSMLDARHAVGLVLGTRVVPCWVP